MKKRNIKLTCRWCKSQLQNATLCSLKCVINLYVEKDNHSECRIWKGTTQNSIPSLRYNGKQKHPRKHLYEEKYGELEKSLVITSTCKNNLCVNVDHCITLTKKELSKYINIMSHETHMPYNVKIIRDKDKIKELFSLRYDHKWLRKDIAKHFNVSIATVKKVLRIKKNMHFPASLLIESEEEFMKLFEE